MINLVLVLHCHQPVGNFDEVFKKGNEKCYRPILEHIEAHPLIRMGIHFSGPLLEWLEIHEPETLEIFASLIERGQVEPLSGGFYEPLLANIPARDAREQVQMMNEHLERRYGFRPKGFWLTERVWDPCIPLITKGLGLDYTVVDDTHFFYAGLEADQIYGPYITEKEGHTLKLFATPIIMRYLIPFKPVEEVIGHLREMMDQGYTTAVYGDDGEKFGMWPGTHDWVIKKGWLERFFAALEANKEWLNTVLPGIYVNENPPLGRLYLPQASYEEMTEWALSSSRGKSLAEIIESLKNSGQWEQWRPYVRGGVWDNFLVKYEESNRMHKKTLFLSERAGQMPEAKRFILRAQCNCAYWHGVFGGLYLGHLRSAIYENLLKAQKIWFEAEGKKVLLKKLDLDKDGRDEILMFASDVSLGICPHRGGSIFELSYLPRALNLQDTLTRRIEAYHGKSFQEGGDGGKGSPHNEILSIHDVENRRDEGLYKLVIEDRYVRASFMDHFMDEAVSIADYERDFYEEQGDFASGSYGLIETSHSEETLKIELARTGSVTGTSVHVKKAIALGAEGELRVSYEIIPEAPLNESCRFGCECNLNLYSDRDEKRYYYLPEKGKKRMLSESGQEEGVTSLELVNEHDEFKALFSLSEPVKLMFFPVLTVSKTEEGLESTYQGSSLLFMPGRVRPEGVKKEFMISVKFVELRPQ